MTTRDGRLVTNSIRAWRVPALGAGAIALLAAAGALQAQVPSSPPPPAPLKPMQFPPYREATLGAGLRLVVVENHELPIVSIALAMPAGARYDPLGQEGLAEFAAELLTKGTATRTADQIAAAIEGVGASLSASAGDDFFSIGTTVLTEHLDFGFGLLSDVLLHSTFPQDELELARKRTLSSLELAKSSPDALAGRFFSKALYGEHPYGRSASDTSVRTLSRDMIRQFAASRLLPDGALLVMAGDITLDGARKLAQRYLGDWKGSASAMTLPPPPPAEPTRIVLINRPGSAQSNIVVGNLGLGPVDPSYFGAAVANKILGGGADSRLFNVLREERGWTYGAGSGLSRKLDTGSFSASTEVRTPVTDSALVELLHQLRLIRTEAVSDSELRAAKGYLVGSFPRQIETPQQVAGQVSSVRLLGLPDDYLKTYRDRLDAVTAADVMAAARRVIHPDSAVIVVVGDGPAIYAGLRQIAPVTIYDASGKTLSPDDLLAKPAARAAFDTAQIVARRDSFEVAVQDNPVGYMTATITKSATEVTYVEETVIDAVGLRQHTDVRMDPSSFAPRVVDQIGTGAGQDLKIQLRYTNGRVTGDAQIPDPRAGTPKVVHVDTLVATGTIDVNALQPLIVALPLARGATFALDAFDASENDVRPMTLTVADTVPLTVPAGQFTAYRVEVTGGSAPYVFYVSQEPVRRLLKIEVQGQPLTFELVN